MLKRKCKITFISHGETIHTQENIISDSEKHPSLTEGGKEEVLNVCNYLKKRGVKSDKIFSSPAKRCIQSARSISSALKQDFEVLDELTTRKFGSLNGKTLESIVKKYSSKSSELPDVEALGGESLEVFNIRVKNVIQEIVDNNPGARITIVTYPSVIQSVVADTLGIIPENQYKILIKTGSMTQISYFNNWSSLIYSDYLPL